MRLVVKSRKFVTFVIPLMLVVMITAQLTGCGKKSSSEDVNSNNVEMTEANKEDQTIMEESTSDSENDTELAEQDEDTDETEESTLNAESTSEEVYAAAAESQVESAVVEEPATNPAPQQPADDGSIIICIDPGHGGDSNGTRETYDGQLILEKNLNYRIATSLKGYLEQYNGVKVILTHGPDSDLSLSGRIDYAVAHGADYFMSVHVNSKSTDEVNSSGCMALMSCSRYQPSNTRVGSLYDTEMRMAQCVISRLNGIGIQIANDWNTENTGGILQRVNTLNESYPDGSQADYYGLLYNGTYAGLPTIIVEHAFLSNESDYRNFLCSDAKLDALAKADAEGLADALSLR